MRRIFFHVVLPLLIGVASLANIVVYRLDNLLRPSWPDLTTASFYAAAAVIVILTAFAIWRLRGWLLALSMVLVIAAGFAPRIVDFFAVSQQQAKDQAEGADVEMEFQSAYLDRSDDVDERIAAKKPYTPEEALDFLDFAADADLSYRSLPDHTPEAFTLVEQAIAGGILDPNALTTTAPTADSPAVTITLAFYDKRIRPSSPHAIEKHAWDVLQILVAHGADLGSADAAALRADLAKTVVLGTGRTIELK
jgi:hypothetical protein